MLLIWSGLGALIPLAVIICAAIVNLSADAQFGPHTYSTSSWSTA